jgi:hypothetical protein
MTVTYTKLDADLNELPEDHPQPHPFVRVSRTICGVAISQIVAALMSEQELPHEAAIAAADAATIAGRAVRAPEVEEAFLWCDRLQRQVLPVKFFPDAEEPGCDWTWTRTRAAAPSGSAWLVDLDFGLSNRSHQSAQGRVRAVLAGQ